VSTPEPSHRDRIRAARGDAGVADEQTKRAAAEQLGDLAEKFGLTVVDMALAFVLDHPAVTSAIIGPRTMEQLESQLSASEVELPEELLDAIDTIVPPGVDLDPGDDGLGSAEPAAGKPAALTNSRRRPVKCRRRSPWRRPSSFVGAQDVGVLVGEHAERALPTRHDPRVAPSTRFPA